MLLLHQVGSVKIGEVVRYTVTYTPSRDRILPSPEKLHVRIHNTSTIALRAAFVHGPYTLSVSAHPSSFNPNVKFENPHRYGVPVFEPWLKAGGSWECELVVPDNVRQAAATGSHGGFGKSEEHDGECATWIIEVASQVVFSTSAAVGYELVVARDSKSLNLTQFLPTGEEGHGYRPGRVSDHQLNIGVDEGHHPAQQKGVFSRAIHIKVEDTASLWNQPPLPGADLADDIQARNHNNGEDGTRTAQHKKPETGAAGNKPPADASGKEKSQKPAKVHLVILTHGLHSNLGADMLFIKESIDAAAKQAKIDAKARRAKARQATKAGSEARPSTNDDDDDDEKQHQDHQDAAPSNAEKKEQDGTDAHDDCNEVGDANDDNAHDNAHGHDDDDDDDDEQVVVRGYSGNATKTERGIKYLGKRLARYILSMTYPDQPFFPIGKGTGQGVGEASRGEPSSSPRTHRQEAQESQQVHKKSTIHADPDPERRRKHARHFKITSISFIGHSLGGLVQMYAVAYVQKHSPQFFNLIKPVNFIALATPFLGLSNENPLYVKFALDFGLVGRTGKDLGLTWRAPTIARSGWGAIVSNLGESAHRKVYGDSQADLKPLLRILPTGPAHTALKKFRNRTIYSNVVNDGIVPLRTSCLLFLDWQGLGRVEKARRDAGLVETVVGFGWAELTGANMVSPRHRQLPADEQTTDSGASTPHESLRQVPQPGNNAIKEDDRASVRSATTGGNDDESTPQPAAPEPSSAGPLAGFFNLFKSSEPPKEQPLSQKQKKILRRGQTMPLDQAPAARPDSSASSDDSGGKPAKATTGSELGEAAEAMLAPPKTTFFESAGDLLNPGFPDVEYLIDPTKRPRTIFYDRVYHPNDIPPPPPKKQHSSMMRRKTSSSTKSPAVETQSSSPGSLSSPQPPPLPPLPPSTLPGNEDGNVYNKAAGKKAKNSKTPDEGGGVGNTGPSQQPQQPQHPRPGETGGAGDVSGMRVEEKIARGYHRDLAWRKVLVKLEPDAHNNICVRRMFANAYGWPVVNHLVDAHFSDSATARMRDADEKSSERARDVAQPPDEHGGETKHSSPASSSPTMTDKEHEDEEQDEDNNKAGGGKNASEAREALDRVPALRGSHRSSSGGGARPRRPSVKTAFTPVAATAPDAASPASSSSAARAFERADSATWSERDWADSADESDADLGEAAAHKAGRGAHLHSLAETRAQTPTQGQTQTNTSSSPATSSTWTWTEKIAGKGAAARHKSGGGGGGGGGDTRAFF